MKKRFDEDIKVLDYDMSLEIKNFCSAKAEEEYRQRMYDEIYYRQNMLVKILMNFGSLLDAM